MELALFFSNDTTMNLVRGINNYKPNGYNSAYPVPADSGLGHFVAFETSDGEQSAIFEDTYEGIVAMLSCAKLGVLLS